MTHLQNRILELETKKIDLFPSSTSLSERLLNLLRKDTRYEKQANQIREEMEIQRRVDCNCYKDKGNTITVNEIMDRLKIKPEYRQILISTLKERKYIRVGNTIFNIGCQTYISMI